MGRLPEESSDILAKTIREIRSGNEKAVKQLYYYLHRNFTSFLESLDKEAMPEKTFQDAFLLLKRHITTGRLNFTSSSLRTTQTVLIKIFERLLRKASYRPERSCFRLIEGVRQNDPLALQVLVEVLQTNNWKIYARKLIARYALRDLESTDLLQEGVLILIKNIQSRKLEMDKSWQNDWNCRKLYKYYRETLFRWVSSEYRKQAKLPLSDMEQPEIKDDSIPDDQLSKPVYDLSLRQKMLDLIHNLDKIGRRILIETYVNRKTPKQIAAAMPDEAWQSTAKIVQKKLESMNQLRRDFGNVVSEFNSEALEQLTAVSQKVLLHLKEPCQTILKYALPPYEKSMKEIAELLQHLRPSEEVAALSAAPQVRKRKYKCMRILHETVLTSVFNP